VDILPRNQNDLRQDRALDIRDNLAVLRRRADRGIVFEDAVSFWKEFEEHSDFPAIAVSDSRARWSLEFCGRLCRPRAVSSFAETALDHRIVRLVPLGNFCSMT